MLTKTDLHQITKIVKSENQNLRKDLKAEMKKGFNTVEKKLDYAINFLDRDYIKLLRRIERIEEHLNLEPMNPHAGS